MKKYSVYFMLLTAFLLINCSSKSVSKDGGIVVEIEIDRRNNESDSLLVNILQKRLDGIYSDNNPLVYFDKSKNLIIAELPEIKEHLFDSKSITSHGRFEISEILNLRLIFDKLAKDSITFSNNDTLQSLFTHFYTGPDQFLINSSDTSKLSAFFANNHIKNILKDIKYSIAYGKTEKTDAYDKAFYFIFLNESNKKFDLSEAVKSAEIERNQHDRGSHISILLKSEYAKAWEELTEKNIYNQLAFLLDNTSLMTPTVAMAISGGALSISGQFDDSQLLYIKSLLLSGSIDSDLTIKSITQH